MACTGDSELAADLAQDTFLVTLTELAQPGAERAFVAWLYRIAQNRLKPALRRRRLRRMVSLEEQREWRDSADKELSAPNTPNDPAAIVVERGIVSRVLDDLTPSLSQALLLNALAGLSASEVAIGLGISSTAAERRISRAKAQFRMRYLELTKDDS